MLGPQSRIQSALLTLGQYELEVIDVFVRRVAAGMAAYGRFCPATESRNMQKERVEEQMDDQVYAAYIEVLRRVRAIEEAESEEIGT